MRWRERPGRDTTGQVGATAVELVAGVGLLVFPVTVLVVSLPVWVEAQQAGRLAVQEAARAAVLAPDIATGEAHGRALAATVLANHRATLVSGVTFTGDAGPGGAVTATATVRVPALVLPLIGDAGGFDLTVSHTEHVEPYRSDR